MKEILPRSCVPCPKIEDDAYDWYKRHDLKREQTRKEQYDIIFIGDSITHFWTDEEGFTHGAEVWHEYYDKRKVFNIGFGFDRTQNVLWRLEHGELDGQNPKLIVLNIGTNHFSVTGNYSGDTAEVAAEGIKAVICKLREMFSETKIAVMAIFPRKADRTVCQDKIDRTNVLVHEFVKTQCNTLFLDLTAQFQKADRSLNTALYQACETHLNPAGYRIWAEALEDVIRSL